jgi:hypothetical protein
MNNLPEIRNDDVLQCSLFTNEQKKAAKKKSMFEWFLEADELFEKYDYPCTLVVLEEGLNNEPKWVEHIKKNIHRYKIELHGLTHVNYQTLNKEDLFENLFWSKKRIETEFGIKISTWYLPFGRCCIPEFGTEVCRELGMKMDIPLQKTLPKFWLEGYRRKGESPFPQVNFHYWYKPQIEQIKIILDLLCQNTK